MPLGSGVRLGPYEILTPLGIGGMGEVYRARDTKLGRDVAVKILPDAFSGDPERVARFEREAQLLAALNHPNIAAIHGLDESGSTKFLVLELVDGESLDQKLHHGSRLMADGSRQMAEPSRGLAVGEALAIARQIIDALEAAHDKGIIHRDLKPANVMLTADGQVKVLDFGLAKLTAGGPGGSGGSAGMNGVTHSPTITTPALMTGAGTILGTAAYMAPEQAKGREADKRSDVWAFGCVFYEMLAGKRAFEGEDVLDTLTSLLKGEPDWNVLPADLAPHVCSILKRCLEKDRRARIPDMSVVRFLLDEPVSAPAALVAAVPPLLRWAIAWKVASVLLLLTTIAAATVAYVGRAAAPTPARFIVPPPEKAAFTIDTRRGTSAAVSPDGRRIAFTAKVGDGQPMLWLRAIDVLTAQPIPSTEGASYPFWSPDSRFIAYFAPDKLMRVAAAGGPPQTICAGAGRGGTWSRDGVIIFSGGPGPLLRVSAAGGEPVKFTNAQPGAGHVFPSFLPDGKHVLFYGAGLSAGVYVAALDTGEIRRVTTADSGAVYSPHDGSLLFVRQGTLLAQPFDPKTLALQQEAVPIGEKVETGSPPGVMTFSVSNGGVLAYGTGTIGGLQLTWLDRQGKVLQTVGSYQGIRGIELDAEGARVAEHRHENSGGDIWVTELARGTTSRVTFDAAQDNASPIWSPDGSRIAFSSARAGKFGIYQKPANGAGAEEKLVESDGQILPQSWSPDGRFLVYIVATDLWLLPLSGDRKPSALLNSRFSEVHGQVSADGKWLAYRSNETGRNEIYVQPFPSGVGKWQVSTSGGSFPRWRRDARELFYMDAPDNGKLLAVDVTTSGSTFARATPKVLFESGYANLPHVGLGVYHPYAVAPDGQRFLIPRPFASSTADAAAAPIVVVLNWAGGLRN